MKNSEIHHFEWDQVKCQYNIDTHGIDFISAKEIWSDDVLESKSPQTNHNEDRYLALGIIGEQERIITVIFTWRNSVKRIISARRARKNEQEIYQNAFGKGS